jgi:hypothetical protein
MYICRLCQLTVDEIPPDAIQCGKLYRFTTGEYHDMRKKLEPRSGLRPRRKTNPDRESPPTNPAAPPLMGTTAREVPEHVEPVVVETPEAVNEAPVGETILARAFRLSKLLGENR